MQPLDIHMEWEEIPTRTRPMAVCRAITLQPSRRCAPNSDFASMPAADKRDILVIDHIEKPSGN
jgi:hypothetical protein